MKIGGYFLVDVDGDGYVHIGEFYKDGYYDSDGSYVSEETAEIQEVLNKYGLRTVNGTSFKDISDYMAIFDRETKKIVQANACNQITDSVDTIMMDAMDSGFLLFRSENNTEVGILTAIAETAPSNYMIPYCIGEKFSQPDRINTEDMDAMFAMAYKTALAQGIDKSAEIDDTRRRTYKAVMTAKNADMKKELANPSGNIIRYSEDFYASFLKVLATKNIKGDDTLFTKEYIEKVTKAANSVRLDGYRLAINKYVAEGSSYLTGGSAQNGNWVRWANEEFNKAYISMKTAGLESEFEAKIAQARKDVYNKMIDMLFAGVDGYIRDRSKNSTNWMSWAKENLASVMKYASEVINIQDASVAVFSESERAAIKARVDEKRKDIYRRRTEDLIDSAKAYLGDDKINSNQYSWANENLNDAEKTAKEGNVDAEYSKAILDQRRAANKKMYDQNKATALGYLNDKSYRWINEYLEGAKKYIGAKANDVFVFSEEERAAMTAELEEIRKQIPVN